MAFAHFICSPNFFEKKKNLTLKKRKDKKISLPSIVWINIMLVKNKTELLQ